MQFHVGPVPYRVVVSDRAIFDEGGSELEGQAVESHRLILLSFRLHPQRREEIALHELAHAYEFHFPPPRTAEDRSQIFAIAAKGFREELEEQGGAEALQQMVPRRVAHLGRPMIAMSPAPAMPAGSWSDRKACECGSDIMCGSISNGEPGLHAPTQQWRIERWARCEACNGLLVWGEICAPDGTPLGTLVANPPPRVLRGREATLWVAGHVAHEESAVEA